MGYQFYHNQVIIPIKNSYCFKDVDGSTFVQNFALHLKKQGKVKVPKFCEFIKTSSSKELGPYDHDWYFTRIASVARRIYLNQGIGVGRLRNFYGGLKSKGYRPRHHIQSSGNIIRKCLQQLEAIGVVEKTKNGGRKISASGCRLLDIISSQC